MNSQIIFAIHQPNYLPWLGYFYKMNRCDVFVYLDTVQFPRGRSFANRNTIKTPNGAIYLSIPVRHPHGHSGIIRYCDVAFADPHWKERHLKTVALNYKRAPYFDEIFGLYQSALASEVSFVEQNIRVIEAVADYLSIGCQRTRLSSLERDFGQKTDLVVDIGKALGAGVYLSGEGARAYNDAPLMQENGIELHYAAFTHPLYLQLWGEFLPNLAILDALFNCGKSVKEML